MATNTLTSLTFDECKELARDAGWKVDQDQNGQLIWTTPKGVKIRSGHHLEDRTQDSFRRFVKRLEQEGLHFPEHSEPPAVSPQPAPPRPVGNLAKGSHGLNPVPVESFGGQLRQARLKAEMSQLALADLLGVSSTLISLWENNASPPSREMNQKLIDLFGDEIAPTMLKAEQNESSQPAAAVPVPPRTRSGQPVTDEMVEKLADEAERGYDPAKLKPRPVEVSAPAGQKLIDLFGEDIATTLSVPALLREVEAQYLRSYQDGHEAGFLKAGEDVNRLTAELIDKQAELDRVRDELAALQRVIDTITGAVQGARRSA